MSVEFIGYVGHFNSSETVRRTTGALDPGFIEAAAKAQEHVGFDRVLVAFNSTSAESILVAQHIASITERLGLMIAHRPDFVTLLQDAAPIRSVAEEWLHRKQRLAATFRLFARHGFDQGLAGHVTARDPEHTDSFWVNPLGRHFGQMRVRDLIRVDHTGAVVEGDRPVNRAAFAIHAAIHAARPDVVAAAHTHSTYGEAWSTLGRLLDPLTQDSCKFYRDHALFDDFAGVVLDTGEGERIAQALGPHKAVILRNHGILTVGEMVEAAA